MSKIFVTSDLHFGHENIIRLCKRPFENADIMDELLITNWNAVVGKGDTVYVLGDFVYKSRYSLEYYCTQLNGNKHLITGNHDHFQRTEYERFFLSQKDLSQIEFNKKTWVLCHYPIYSWNKRAHGSYHLYGHVHNAQMPVMTEQLSYNVSVECNNYTPVDLEYIQEILEAREKEGKWKSSVKSVSGVQGAEV